MIILLLAFLIFPPSLQKSPPIDENGYLLYCPCMGRFGNQMDHLLGSLKFAKNLNRTLVVPPFIEYRGHRGNRYVSYSDWFDLAKLAAFHRVVEMREFVDDLSPEIWKDKTVYCHEVAMKRSSEKGKCPAKQGNPFGPFWDNFNVTFDRSKSYKLNFASPASQWNRKFPKSSNRVMALMGAPANYPVLKENRVLQKYVDWNGKVVGERDRFIGAKLIGPYLAVHLRNGADWLRACNHVTEEGTSHPFMSSPQCTDRRGILFTNQMCFPPPDVVLSKVLKVVMATGAKHLFVATDNDPMRKEFEQLFRGNGLDVEVVTFPRDSVKMDLAVMVEADWFVGSCASSITAMVARKRAVEGKPSGFFGVEEDLSHSEL